MSTASERTTVLHAPSTGSTVSLVSKSAQLDVSITMATKKLRARVCSAIYAMNKEYLRLGFSGPSRDHASEYLRLGFPGSSRDHARRPFRIERARALQGLSEVLPDRSPPAGQQPVRDNLPP